MLEVELVGDEKGLALWNKLAVSTMPIEQEYFESLTLAASRYGSIWYSDLLKRINSKSNQPIYHMSWDGMRWTISLFCIPDPTPLSKPDTYDIEEMEITPL